MFRPNFLQTGDKVALISPAGYIEQTHIDYAVQLLLSWGLEAVVGKHALNRHGYFAGTDAERMEDLQGAMDAEEIKAIFCTRGGYGCMRIVEQLDYSIFQGNPKWLVGFSDITVLHSKLTSLGIESLHAPMPKSYENTDRESMKLFQNFLFGNITSYSLPHHPLNREGIVRGELTGGNLCMLHCVRSTIIEYRSHRSVLFLEEVGENLYAVDRMMQSLKLAGRLSNLQGLIVGDFSKMQGENFNKSAYEIIRETVEDYDYPVCFGFPAGHAERNAPLIMGADVELTVESSGSELVFV
ncbi:LD-carboxypeptidase [Odoribacter sp. OttesenSCG-928-J03]|nr:LD-carboxypeptidase [Odoribacter sp. OttesenSCG-928-J03]MDL2330956.1 LD-carboxypeptidase [Odoribacter sp. OttesenSCG-928-A06]